MKKATKLQSFYIFMLKKVG